MVKLLGSGYPWEVTIEDPKTREMISIFVQEDAALAIKADLQKQTAKYFDF